MKKLVLLLVCLGLCGLAPALADVLWVCGDVSGTWDADTVVVWCEVRVPPGDTLIIAPGVKVLFWVYCKFIVDDGAVLRAVGTPTDTILFDEYVSGTRQGNRWNGIRFLNASDSSRLEYCHMIHGWATGSGEDVNGGAIYCSYSSPTIRNCLIDSCSANNYGGGIYCTSSSPAIDSTIMRGNSASSDGGGICCSNSSPTISANTIYGNSTDDNGGGIFCNTNSNPTVTGNTISENSADDIGGGISCFNNSNPAISGNNISGNSAGGSWNYGGGGISCYLSSPTITGNTIRRNSAPYAGGGISCWQSNPTIQSCLIDSCSAWNGGGILCYNSSPTISGNTITRSSASDWGGGIACNSNSNPMITGNTISGNLARYYGGGGISFGTNNPTISSNTITGNSAPNGGGIYCSSIPTPSTIELNEISQNAASGDGGGIYLSDSSPALNKNTIVDNTAASGGGLYCTGSSPVLRNCILWGNTPQMIYQISGSNVQVSYSDCQSFWPGLGNINSDPLFVNPGLSDYHLLCSSPCIDSGDPNPLYNDPDGTRADMGCYYFEGWTSLPVLVTWMDGDMLRLAWQRACPASTYNVLYASEPFSALWSPLTTTADTTITDDISGADKRFYSVSGVR